MTPGELLFVAFVWGIPLVLVTRAWWRYSTLPSTPTLDSLSVRTALTLLSLSMALWLFALFLMSVDDRGHWPTALLNLKMTLTPGSFFLINFPLCVAAFVFSLFRRKTVPGTLPLKKSVGLASACLALIWLLFASNPH